LHRNDATHSPSAPATPAACSPSEGSPSPSAAAPPCPRRRRPRRSCGVAGSAAGRTGIGPLHGARDARSCWRQHAHKKQTASGPPREEGPGHGVQNLPRNRAVSVEEQVRCDGEQRGEDVGATHHGAHGFAMHLHSRRERGQRRTGRDRGGEVQRGARIVAGDTG
jgi:hypothetical protein